MGETAIEERNWQREFIRLYTSANLDDGRKSFALKSKHLPPKLYRYRPVSESNLCHRIREITEGELFLSHPKEFNDPFECWSVLHSASPTKYVDKFTYVDYYYRTGKTEELRVILQNDEWFEALTAMQISKATSSSEAEETKRAIEESIMFAMEDINKEIRKRITDMIRFASFSTTATNLPMWYHYTDKRKGICLEYSTQDIIDVYQRNSLFPVQYVEHLPDMTYMLAHRDKTMISMPVYLSFHKLKDWAYENEWRMIYDSGYWTRNGQRLPAGFEDKGVAINFIRPSKVILGTDIEPNIEERITTCAQSSGIKVVKAELTEYGLSIE